MTATLKRIPKPKSSAKPAKRHIAKLAKRVKPMATPKGKTLAELNRWMTANAAEIMEAAKKNTLLLTGKEVL